MRRIAKENGVDLAQVPATGRQGRVLKGDVLEYLNLVPAGTNIPHPTLAKRSPIPAPVQLVADREEVLKGVRKIMFRTMSESLVINRAINFVYVVLNIGLIFRKFLTLRSVMKLI